jgi:hypothetical protein
MDRKNIWILGGAIVLGFLVFGLSQLWAQQRFPGDGRGESMVGRYQVVRSSPEVILLLDTVTGELYSAGQDDIRPSRARPRAGENRDPGLHKDKGDFRERVPEPAFKDKEKVDFRKDDFKDKGDFRREEFKDKGDFKGEEFKDKGDFRRDRSKDKSDFRREEFKDKVDFRRDGFKDKGKDKFRGDDKEK